MNPNPLSNPTEPRPTPVASAAPTPLRVLIVEDREEDAWLLVDALRRGGFAPTWERVDTAAAVRDALARSPWDCVLADYTMPQFSGPAALDLVQHTGHDLPFLVVSGTIGEENAAAMMRQGAHDYLLKDNLARLVPALRRELAEAETRRQRRQAETALRESEALYHSLVEQLPKCVFRKDRDGRITFANQRFCDLLGQSFEELRGKTDADLFPPELAAQYRADDLRVMTDGVQWTGIERHRPPDTPGDLYVEVVKAPLRDATGRVIGVQGMFWDVTARQRAVEALRTSEARLRQAQQLAHIGSWEEELGAAGNHSRDRLWWSDETYRIFGYDPGSVPVSYGLFMGALPPEDQAAVRAAVERAAVERTPYDVQHRVRRPDGVVRIVHEHAEWIWDDSGTRPVKLVGTVQDITERQRAEEALARNEQELSAIYEHAPIMMLLLDADRRVRRLNRAVSEFVGRPADELLNLRSGELLGCLYASDDPRGCGFGPVCSRCPLRLAMLDTVATGAVHHRFLVRPTLITGRETPHLAFLASTAPVSVGPDRMVLLCLEDITALKTAEERARSQAALLDQTRDAVLAVDLNHRVTYCNQSAERLFGQPTPALLGTDVRGLLFPQDPAEAARVFQATVDSGHCVREDRLDATEPHRIVESRYTLVRDVVGAPAAVFIVLTDLTEKKRLEGQHLHTQRLESIGTLAMGLAHDLNNMLSPIQLSSELLRSYELDADGREMVETIGASAQRAADLLRQLLLFSRGGEATQVELQPSLVVREIGKLMRETFPRNLQCEIVAPTDLPRIMAAPTHLHQLLLNLCVNARDAMPEGGRLTLAAATVDLDEAFVALEPRARPGRHVRFEVQDTGVGIRPEILDRIFDPFFTTKPLGQGTGLGLATVLGIASSHGGFVQVRSAIGQGSTFRVYLPVGTAPDQPPAAAALAPVPRAQGELLLMVDDEPAVCAIARRTLTAHGYDVITCADGSEALARYSEHAGRLRGVVTDLMMPGMDGLALIRVLRRIAPDLPIVAMSGLPQQTDAAVHLGGPHTVGIGKPFSVHGLLATLDTLLHESPASDPGR